MNNFFITYSQALAIIDEVIQPLGTVSVPLSNALNRSLAEDVYSPIAMPPFDQSAMDGYAVKIDSKSYKVVGKVQAGDKATMHLSKGEAIRIFTGAMVPTDADCVVRQEDVTIRDQDIQIDIPLKAGTNVRPKGEQVEAGALALKANTRLNPAGIGYLSTLGLTEVSVYKKPKVTILTTGNELVKPGTDLEQGKIYESNSIMLETACKQYGIKSHVITVKDDLSSTRKSLEIALEQSDIVLTSGGISVGDYDFVHKALEEIGVQQLFYKVRQKPGKPLYFGRLDNKFVFSLPGNPAAALTSFYKYVVRALNAMSSNKEVDLTQLTAVLGNSYTKKPGLTHLLKGCFKDNRVFVLSSQSSAMLSSFAEANCLITIPEDCDTMSPGEMVNIQLLPSM